jgi:hypothetical protein
VQPLGLSDAEPVELPLADAFHVGEAVGDAVPAWLPEPETDVVAEPVVCVEGDADGLALAFTDAVRGAEGDCGADGDAVEDVEAQAIGVDELLAVAVRGALPDRPAEVVARTVDEPAVEALRLLLTELVTHTDGPPEYVDAVLVEPDALAPALADAPELVDADTVGKTETEAVAVGFEGVIAPDTEADDVTEKTRRVTVPVGDAVLDAALDGVGASAVEDTVEQMVARKECEMDALPVDETSGDAERDGLPEPRTVTDGDRDTLGDPLGDGEARTDGDVFDDGL